VPVVAPLIAWVTDKATTVYLDGRVEHLGRAIGRWSCMANLAMGPSTTIPVGLGRESGLPVAVQAIGRFGDDLATIGFAREVARRELVPRLRPPASDRL
jgi:Asp-tRNA(Asn)/Glu-tRNA(Gln) amidotransferase A subunit family amidase